MSQPSFRDVEMLSAYLDGQLSGVDTARLETRIKTDPGLRSVYNDLRQSRALLRKLPARRAPRNFTLTPKMAGIKPPLPRSFPFFRLASALAAVLFFFSYAANLSVPVLAAMRAAAPASSAFGMGGGGPGEEPSAAVMPAPTEASSAPAEEATQAPEPLATATAAGLSQQDSMTVAPTTEILPFYDPSLKVQIDPYATRNGLELAPKPQPVSLPVQPVWLFGLLALAVVSGGGAWFVRAKAEQDWRKANKVGPRKLTGRQVLLLGLAILVVLLLGAGIYWMSTTTFYAPVAPSITYPAGPAGGDKGNVPTAAAEDIHLEPGMGYGFSTVDVNGLITAIDFPAGAVQAGTDLRYIPGLQTIGPDVAFFANRAFTLIPAPKSVTLQAPIMVTLDYDYDTSAIAAGRELMLYWWSGSEWYDAASTCGPASAYERLPQRIRVAVCQFGSFLLVAP